MDMKAMEPKNIDSARDCVCPDCFRSIVVSGHE